MTTYYVSTSGSDSGSGSAGSPWKTISKAMKANLKPGDEVVVKSGTYKEGVTLSKDGVTLRSEVPGGAKIDPPSGKLGININADNVTIKGFEVYGSSTAGIAGSSANHVKVIGNIVHDNVGNGIVMIKSDYITIDGNVVYNNASMGARSGISVFHPKAVSSDGSGSQYRIVISNNVVYNNINKSGAHTDGNGIILDDFNSTQDGSLPAYKYPVLVDNNIVYQNGGAGVMVYNSENATLRDNIAWHNQRDTHSSKGTWRSEFQTQASDNITWIDNTGVADQSVSKYNVAFGSFSFTGDKNVGITWRGNITFNGKAGDDAISTNNGNAGPSAKDNKLGVNPGLDFSDIKAMAARLGATSSSASASAAAVTDSAAADGDNGGGTVKHLTLTGDAGKNVLTGGVGDDTLSGKGGADKLLGGTGDDVLTGGKGADHFVFKSVAAADGDTITDFSHVQGDRIDLSAIDANLDRGGNQAFSFIGSDGFSGKAGQLQYKNGIVSGDVDGDKVADFHIDIANHAALHANDFIL